MKNLSVQKRLGLLVAAAVAAAVIVAISNTSEPTPPTPVTCSKPTTTVLLGGVSGSQRGPAQRDRFLTQAREVLYRTAVCGGSVAIEAWSTAGSTRVLWGRDDVLTIVGDTLQARKLSATRAIGPAMTTVSARYDRAVSVLTAKGSAFLAWRSVAADALSELAGTGQSKAVIVADDGVQIDDTMNLNRPLTTAEATELAKTVPVTADLHDVTVTLIGVGQVAGPQPAGGEWIRAVRAFAMRTCTVTGATCQVIGSSVTAGDR